MSKSFKLSSKLFQEAPQILFTVTIISLFSQSVFCRRSPFDTNNRTRLRWHNLRRSKKHLKTNFPVESNESFFLLFSFAFYATSSYSALTYPSISRRACKSTIESLRRLYYFKRKPEGGERRKKNVHSEVQITINFLSYFSSSPSASQ